MKLIMFAKHLREFDIPGLVEEAKAAAIDGFDCPVREGYAVNPGNVKKALPELVRAMESEGLSVPMCTGGAVVDPDDPQAETVLAAMALSGVSLYKMSYFPFDPLVHNYRQEIDRARRLLTGWEKLAGRHGVTVCYHTHAGHYLGCSAASLRSLIEGFDPQCIGAYLDAGHLTVAGEPFPVACGMVDGYLKAVAIKARVKVWEKIGGINTVQFRHVPLGEGFLDLDVIFSHLLRIGFPGPVSLHVEYGEKLQEPIKGGRRDAEVLRKSMDAAQKRERRT